MASGIEKFYSPLPGWAKGLTVIVGAGLLYWIYSTTRPKPPGLKTAADDLSAADGELSNLAKSGIFPTLSDSTLSNMSDNIVTACSGCSTDTEMISNTFALCKNDADIAKFIKSFGSRPYQVCGLNPLAWQNVFNNNAAPVTLSAMLAANMSAAHLSDLNSQLISQGLTYQF